jgi:hypothetical protein
MLQSKENNIESSTVQFSVRLPVGIAGEIGNIFYSERRESRTEVAIELLNLGLAVKRGEYIPSKQEEPA